MLRLLKLALLFISLLFALSCTLQATQILYVGSSGNLAASAFFELSESTLKIVLTNTSNADVLYPTDVLTGLFFDSSYTFAPTSASLNGSSIVYGSTDDPGNGWGYASGINAQGMNSAISVSGAVSGLGQSNFSEMNFNLGGLDYGILSMGDDPFTGNRGITGKGPLFKNSLEFTLLTSEGFALENIGSMVVFQYGTSLSDIVVKGYDPPIPPTVPEPSTILLLGTGMCVLVLLQRRKIRSFYKSSNIKHQ
jgi:hypothetical protein